MRRLALLLALPLALLAACCIPPPSGAVNTQPDDADPGRSDAVKPANADRATPEDRADVEVNEQGAEASAATAVLLAKDKGPDIPPQKMVFRADHPFVFLIRDGWNGPILFLGRVTNPGG